MSSYSRLPSSEEKEEKQEKSETAKRAARVRAAAEETAGVIGDTLGSSFKKASSALSAPEGTDVTALLKDTDLPELAGEDPIIELATRLDREADLWRNLALREMARGAWSSRIAQLTAGVAALVDVGLAVIAGLGALFGSEQSWSRVLLIASAALVVTLGAGVVAWISMSTRKQQTVASREALARADLAELRLHRLAVVLAWRKHGDTAMFQDALARLERDASG